MSGIPQGIADAIGDQMTLLYLQAAWPEIEKAFRAEIAAEIEASEAGRVREQESTQYGQGLDDGVTIGYEAAARVARGGQS